MAKRVKLVKVTEERKPVVLEVIAEGRKLYPDLSGAALAEKLPVPYQAEALTLLLPPL